MRRIRTLRGNSSASMPLGRRTSQVSSRLADLFRQVQREVAGASKSDSWNLESLAQGRRVLRLVRRALTLVATGEKRRGRSTVARP
jgi:hypothetical protein